MAARASRCADGDPPYASSSTAPGRTLYGFAPISLLEETDGTVGSATVVPVSVTVFRRENDAPLLAKQSRVVRKPRPHGDWARLLRPRERRCRDRRCGIVRRGLVLHFGTRNRACRP